MANDVGRPPVDLHHGAIREEGSKIWSARVVFKTIKGTMGELIVPLADLRDRKKLAAQLLNHACNLPNDPAREKELLDGLAAARPEKTRVIVKQTGWHDRIFVLPEKVLPVGNGDELVLAPLDRNSYPQNPFGEKGDLQGWQTHVARPAACSSRMMLAIGIALASPLLEFAPTVESGGFHTAAKSGMGKTTAELVGLSVSGLALRSELLNWNSTDAGLHEAAESHNHLLLCIDDMSMAPETGRQLADLARRVSYTLASGAGRARSKAYNATKGVQKAKWRLFFLSSGEKSLADVAKEGGVKRMPGDEVRFIDLPGKVHDQFGIFERLPKGVPDSRTLVKAIETACTEYHGTALRAFLAFIGTNFDGMPSMITNLMKEFITRAKVPPELQRLADRFALVYAALMLAIDAKVLPWAKPHAGRAIYRCYRDAVSMLPDMARTLNNGPFRFKEQIRRTDLIITYKPKSPPSPEAMDAADGVRRFQTSFGGDHYVLKQERFLSWFEDRLQGELVLQHLRDCGALFSNSQQVLLKNIKGKPRYIVIRADALSKI